MASKVYFTNFRCEGNENLLQKFRRLCETAGLQVLSMKRIRLGGVAMGKLPPGQWRYMREGERF